MMKKIALGILLALSIFAVAPIPQAHAQKTGGDTAIGICTFIKPICDAIGLDNNTSNPSQVAENFIVNRGRLLLGLLFLGITLMAIFIIVQAGIKYIQSQGDEKKIEEANKAIKSVLAGIAVLIVGVVGVLLVLFFLGGGGGFLTLGGGDDPVAQCVQACVNEGSKSTTQCAADCAETTD
jgi:hypothetical protein